MNVYKTDDISSNILFLLLGTYTIFSILNIDILTLTMKYITLLVALSLFAILLMKGRLEKADWDIYWPYILFIFLYLFQIDNLDGLLINVNHIAYFIVSFLVYKISWKKRQIKQLSRLFYFYIPFFVIASTASGIGVNSNSLSAIILFSSFFPILYNVGYKKRNRQLKAFVILLLVTVLIFLTGSRSIMLALAFGLVTYISWRYFSKSKALYNLYFGLVSTFIFFTTLISPYIYRSKYFPMLNQLSHRLFDKPLLTGRDNIWRNLIDAISIKPWTGYGASYAPTNLYETNFSSHNLYLQIALQVGLFGVILLFIFLFRLWNKSYIYSADSRTRVVCSFLIAIIIHQTFEVSLTQNYFVIGLIQWMIISLGFSYLRDFKKENNVESKT